MTKEAITIIEAELPESEIQKIKDFVKKVMEEYANNQKGGQE